MPKRLFSRTCNAALLAALLLSGSAATAGTPRPNATDEPAALPRRAFLVRIPDRRPTLEKKAGPRRVPEVLLAGLAVGSLLLALGRIGQRRRPQPL